MSEYILEAKNLTFNYLSGQPVLSDVSLKIEKGKKTVFLGENGAGKTTLFLHFNGIFKPEKGKIFYRGKEVKYSRSSIIELRKNIGIVFQEPDTQLFSASVEQEVSFGPMNLGLSLNEVQDCVDYALEITNTSEFKNKPTHFLSSGQKKRVTIAGILAMKPEVIIFDEPTNYLDPKHREELIAFLEELNKSGITIILSTHDMDLAYEWADNIVVMHKGNVVMEGTSDYIFSDIEFLKKMNLCLPCVLDFYYEMQRSGIISNKEPLPKTKEDLFRLIGTKV